MTRATLDIMFNVARTVVRASERRGWRFRDGAAGAAAEMAFNAQERGEGREGIISALVDALNQATLYDAKRLN